MGIDDADAHHAWGLQPAHTAEGFMHACAECHLRREPALGTTAEALLASPLVRPCPRP